jgi:hypothetical protein
VIYRGGNHFKTKPNQTRCDQQGFTVQQLRHKLFVPSDLVKDLSKVHASIPCWTSKIG